MNNNWISRNVITFFLTKTLLCIQSNTNKRKYLTQGPGHVVQILCLVHQISFPTKFEYISQTQLVATVITFCLLLSSSINCNRTCKLKWKCSERQAPYKPCWVSGSRDLLVEGRDGGGR